MDVNAEVKKDVVPGKYRDKYKETGGTCGDFIAEALSKVAKDGMLALDSVKAENGVENDKWKGMNPGMQRMNLANTLRASYLRGETIKILGREYNVAHQCEDFNGEVTNDPSTMLRVANFLGLQQNNVTVKSLTKLFFPPENTSAVAKAEREAKREAKREAAKAEKEAAKAKKSADREAAKAEKEAAKAKKAADREAAKAAKAVA